MPKLSKVAINVSHARLNQSILLLMYRAEIHLPVFQSIRKPRCRRSWKLGSPEGESCPEDNPCSFIFSSLQQHRGL
jgi:hypothetical protein